MLWKHSVIDQSIQNSYGKKMKRPNQVTAWRLIHECYEIHWCTAYVLHTDGESTFPQCFNGYISKTKLKMVNHKTKFIYVTSTNCIRPCHCSRVG